MSLIDLYISDGGSIRRIGDNQHDMLTIEDGELCYYNLQNGDGCRLGEDGEWYKFVDNVDEYGYNCDPRKTENSSEIPNNCEDLQDWKDRMWAEAIVTEPTISKMEQVDEPQINEADEYWLSLLKDVVDGKLSDAGANQAWLEYINHKDEPTGYNLSPVDKDINVRSKDEPQTDCQWK